MPRPADEVITHRGAAAQEWLADLMIRICGLWTVEDAETDRRRESGWTSWEWTRSWQLRERFEEKKLINFALLLQVMELFTECVCLMVPYLLKHDAMTPRGASPASGESKPASQPTRPANQRGQGRPRGWGSGPVSVMRKKDYMGWDWIVAGRQADQGVVM